MSWPHDRLGNPSALSPRERACLDLAARGLTALEAGERLGISGSTVNKLLASARAKLGASRTAEAVALWVARGEIGPAIQACPDPVEARLVNDRHVLQACEDLASDLRSCPCFADAWFVLRRHIARQGASSVQFAVHAAPKGRLTTGARMIAMSLPDELLGLYGDAGGMEADPFAGWLANGGGWLSLKTDRVPAPNLPRHSRGMYDFASALPDHGYRCILGTVMQDPATGASFALPFGFRSGAADDAMRHEDHYRRLQYMMSATFWQAIQERALLREFVPLSARMREALQDSARGLGAAESAARMGISRRAVEKLLSETRQVFAAPTTAAAIYRANVYRVLG
ncbi:helix-turn-helix transcriptional regulator [Paracoccus sp. 2205BS29-5]|uniref:Helix-turn-helix transcriptional regulator n=1 Tax=Paracoccus spongiarum TaxID=3064387 RepID=A0ABT9JG75_9RHOB|nr:helix-turn-helix transcriptional regulator [Paracoccus sp. 2205BS29-5]MDP5308625.1 helix-turn-helix transcriptional regulator [Paracoccus sp. 2205BS29-5]